MIRSISDSSGIVRMEGLSDIGSNPIYDESGIANRELPVAGSSLLAMIADELRYMKTRL